jgi:hypothetical protein
LDLEDSKAADLPSLFAQVRQNPNSFTLLSITDEPDFTCTGPDVMKRSYSKPNP